MRFLVMNTVSLHFPKLVSQGFEDSGAFLAHHLNLNAFNRNMMKTCIIPGSLAHSLPISTVFQVFPVERNVLCECS